MSSPPYSLFDVSSRRTTFRTRPTTQAFIALQQSQQQQLLQQQHHRAGLNRANATPRKRRTIKDEVIAFVHRQSRGPPKYPAYLKDTVYASLVHQQYKLYQSQFSKQHRQRPEPLFAVDKLTPDSIIAALISHDLRLPTAWNPADMGELVDISADCMELVYKGAGKDDSDISAVRANFPFRPQCGLFYYEVEIVSKGVDGHIGIGFCWASTTLDKLPGWEEHSWGYHGDDGHLFSGPGTSRAYGPKFGTGDMIGCGFDFRTKSAFYTKNGVYLGTAFKNVQIGSGIYPFVGFKTHGEHIRANFGSHDFVFDIEQYFQDEQHQTTKDVLSHSPSRSLKPDDVVLEYLLHNGYSQTAVTLLRSIRCGNEHDEEEMNAAADATHRREIRSALLNGDVDRVIHICNEHYPGVLDNNTSIRFRLSCRKFVEMVRELHRKECYPMDVDDSQSEGTSASTLSDGAKQHAGVKRRRSQIEHKNEEDGEISSSSRNEDKGKEESGDADREGNETMMRIMAYGKKLQQSYGSMVEDDPELKTELMVTFSSLAYTNLEESAISYLFEPSQVEKLATDLNSAILVHQNRPPATSLERLYRQTTAAINELVLGGNSQAAMLAPERLLPKQ